jgi:hypothetical protein
VRIADMALWSKFLRRMTGEREPDSVAHHQAIDPARIEKVLASIETQQPSSDALKDQLFGLMASAQMEGDPTSRMKLWLEKQTAEVVDAVAQSLNWDHAEDVIIWLLQRKKTDVATAVKLFMKSEPSYFIKNPERHSDSFEVRVYKTFSSNWIAGHYASGTIGYDPSKPTYSNDDIIKIWGSLEVKAQSGELIDFSKINDLRFIEEFEKTQQDLLAKNQFNGPLLRGLRGPFEGPEPKDLGDYFRNDKEGYFTLRSLLGGLGSMLIETDGDGR